MTTAAVIVALLVLLALLPEAVTQGVLVLAWGLMIVGVLWPAAQMLF